MAVTGVIALPRAHSQPPLPRARPTESADRLQADQPVSGVEASVGKGVNDGQDLSASLTEDELSQIDEWIEQLGSTNFATRERASGHLMEKGAAVLPMLHQAASQTGDAETRLRAEQIIKQMTDGDLQARINEFLAGQEVGFEGWAIARQTLGDSIPIRELFVNMMTAHPDFVKSLELEKRDRSLALDKLITSVQGKLRSVNPGPEAADVFAMLLIANDPDVTLDNLFDSILLDLMRRQAASVIRRDAQLSGPFQTLLDRWLFRCGTVNREEALLLGMSWDLPATLPLALQTLGEVNSTETIATCFQVISKFGDRRQTEILKLYLDDARTVSDRGFTDDQLLPQVRDIAMLALAMICNVPLDEIGMSHVQIHPARGFILPDIAYSSDPERSRKRARERIDQLLEEKAE